MTDQELIKKCESLKPNKEFLELIKRFKYLKSIDIQQRLREEFPFNNFSFETNILIDNEENINLKYISKKTHLVLGSLKNNDLDDTDIAFNILKTKILNKISNKEGNK